MRFINDIAILREMLVPTIQVPLQQGPGRPSVELTDTEAGTTVGIKGIPHDAIVIRAENFETPLDIFTGSKGERKRADFVIVSNDESGKWIICIETQKGDYKKPAEVVEQLKGAQCFISYCKCIGKSFWKSEEFLDGYQYRFVSIANIDGKARKQKILHLPSKLHDSPEDFLKIARGSNYHFSKLTEVPR